MSRRVEIWKELLTSSTLALIGRLIMATSSFSRRRSAKSSNLTFAMANAVGLTEIETSKSYPLVPRCTPKSAQALFRQVLGKLFEAIQPFLDVRHTRGVTDAQVVVGAESN